MPRDADRRYQAYLLRCWEERGQPRAPAGGWRFSLEDPHTGQRRGFASLAALVAALEQLTTPADTADGDAGQPGRSHRPERPYCHRQGEW